MTPEPPRQVLATENTGHAELFVLVVGAEVVAILALMFGADPKGAHGGFWTLASMFIPFSVMGNIALTYSALLDCLRFRAGATRIGTAARNLRIASVLGLDGLLFWVSILLTEGYQHRLVHFGSTGLLVPLVWYGGHVVVVLVLADVLTRRSRASPAPPKVETAAVATIPLTRPAPVVAAAVLLLGVAGELLLAAVAGTIAGLVWGSHAGYLIVGLLAGVFAVALLACSLKLLRGTLTQPREAGRVILVLGSFGVALLPCGMWIAVFSEPAMRDNGPYYGMLLTAVGSLSALFVAGLLLRRHADRYLLWREAFRARPSADYEPDDAP